MSKARENSPQLKSAAKDDTAAAKYRAPALEKGLDVLELLVSAARPLTMNEICQSLGRSQGEMFRMVQVLQTRGFLGQDRSTDGYYLTDLLFTMAIRQPPTQGLVEIALPKMRALALEIGQSCHLALHARGEIVVVARMESNEQIGFSVRVGHRVSMVKSVSGTMLFAGQPDDVREKWLAMLPPHESKADIQALLPRATAAAKAGYACAASSYVNGVHDISAPIIRGDRAAAVLTVPFIKHSNLRHTLESATELLVQTTQQISAMLVEGDSRV